MSQRNDKPAVVVLSGGQDSATCLALARETHPLVYAISFDYGQRHAVELSCASRLCAKWHVRHTIVEVNQLRTLVSSALLDRSLNVGDRHERLKELPASFVPARNALMLTLAHAYAAEVDAGVIYTGVCQTDYSGYPDCREKFINLLEQALNTGYDANIRIVTPMMHIDKAATFAMAARLGVLDEIVTLTHTCYNGVHDDAHFHPWGYGCGMCPACDIRAKGWTKFVGENLECTQ
jgi:7-cyano-7-deazaguanine synthase